MSSYNGELFIEKQVDSIFAQKSVEVELIVRDDGSKDGTISLLENYYKAGKNIRIIKGDNLGCEKSFFQLISEHSDADYFEFSDQDDFWEPEKMISAIDILSAKKNPSLVACNMLVSDEELTPIRVLRSDDEIVKLEYRMKKNWFCNVHGCTMVWNKELQVLLQSYIPSFNVPHDIWVNTVANAVGECILQNETYIRYRIHGNNVCGYAGNIFQRFKKAIKIYILNNPLESEKVAQAILKEYSNYVKVSEPGYVTLECISNYKTSLRNKIRLMNMSIIKECQLSDRLFRSLCILLNKY